MSIEALIETIRLLPEPLVRQVGDYVDFLRERYDKDDVDHQWFWDIIASVDNSKNIEHDRFVKLEKQLYSVPTQKLEEFIKIRDHYLRQLDGPTYHKASKTGHSSDKFLFARAGVIVNGRSAYQQVFEHPEKFPTEAHSELLISLPEDIFEAKTGKPTDLGSGILYESFTNEERWGKGALESKFGKPAPKDG